MNFDIIETWSLVKRCELQHQ